MIKKKNRETAVKRGVVYSVIQSQQHTHPAIYKRRSEFLKKKGKQFKKRTQTKSFADLFDKSIKGFF